VFLVQLIARRAIRLAFVPDCIAIKIDHLPHQFGQSLDINDRENMLNLDRPLRHLQRGLRKEMRGFSEKLHMLEEERKGAHKTLQYLKIP